MYGVLYGSAGLGLDTGTRAYILSLYTDLFPALICPAAIFYGAPTIRCSQYSSHCAGQGGNDSILC